MTSTALTLDSFSFRRVGAIMKLMYPRLRTTMIAFFVVGVVSILLAFLISRFVVFLTLLPFITLIPCLLFYIAPSFVVPAMTADQLNLLPATAGEKLTALTAYGLIILPLLCYFVFQGMVTYLTIDVANANKPELLPALEYMQTMPMILMAVNWIGCLLPGSVCQYAALVRPGKRWFAAAMAILVPIAQGLIGGVVGVVSSLRSDLFQSIGPDFKDNSEAIGQFTTQLIHDISTWVVVLNIICCLLTFLFLWMSYRRLATRQI